MLYVMGVLTEEVKLPSEEEMLREEQEDYEERLRKGLPHR